MPIEAQAERGVEVDPSLYLALGAGKRGECSRRCQLAARDRRKDSPQRARMTATAARLRGPRSRGAKTQSAAPWPREPDSSLTSGIAFRRRPLRRFYTPENDSSEILTQVLMFGLSRYRQ